MYLVFTLMPGEIYGRQIRSLLLCLCDVFRAIINSLVCCFIFQEVKELTTSILKGTSLFKSGFHQEGQHFSKKWKS